MMMILHLSQYILMHKLAWARAHDVRVMGSAWELNPGKPQVRPGFKPSNPCFRASWWEMNVPTMTQTWPGQVHGAERGLWNVETYITTAKKHNFSSLNLAMLLAGFIIHRKTWTRVPTSRVVGMGKSGPLKSITPRISLAICPPAEWNRYWQWP